MESETDIEGPGRSTISAGRKASRRPVSTLYRPPPACEERHTLTNIIHSGISEKGCIERGQVKQPN